MCRPYLQTLLSLVLTAVVLTGGAVWAVSNMIADVRVEVTRLSERQVQQGERQAEQGAQLVKQGAQLEKLSEQLQLQSALLQQLVQPAQRGR